MTDLEMQLSAPLKEAYYLVDDLKMKLDDLYSTCADNWMKRIKLDTYVLSICLGEKD